MRIKNDECLQKHKAVMAQYGVSTLPEIITLKKGYKSAVKYTGVHSEWALRSFALKLVGPSIAQLTTEAEVSGLLDENLNATVPLTISVHETMILMLSGVGHVYNSMA